VSVVTQTTDAVRRCLL